MLNHYLPEGDAREIDALVEKVLKDLGEPTPPLSLDHVRELLRLDLKYYSSTDTGIITETAHRMRLAGKQLYARPALLIDAIKKWDLKALWVPDGRRILIDSDEPTPKHRWNQAHEVGHSMIPWHESFMHGDQRITLSVGCHEELESQANYAAARLLFLRDGFRERLLSGEVTFDRVRNLAGEFKNTMTTTLWRAVEAMDAPAVGMVSCHPKEKAKASEPVRYFLRSKLFEQQFGTVTADAVLGKLSQICTGWRGPIGASEVVISDDAGNEHLFFLETFHNHHDALTLGIYRGPKTVRVAVH